MAGEWPTSTVGAVSRRVTKGTTPTTIGGCFVDAGIAFVKVESITDDGRFDRAKFAFIDDHTNHLLARSVLEENDVLFTIAGTIGRVARVSRHVLPANTNQAVAIVRPDHSAIDSRFLYYVLRDDLRVKHAHTRVVQSVQANFSLAELSAIEVPLPPVPEQRAIAHILGTLDDKIELSRRMNETLEAMTRALFKSWFVDFNPVRAKSEGRDPGLPKHIADLFPDSFEDSELGEIPRGWEVTVLDPLADVVLGGDWGGDAHNAERSMPACCIRGADIPDLQIGGRGKMPVRFLKPSSLAKRQLTDGDLVVEISGGSPTQSTGRPVLVSRELLDRLPLPLVCSNFCRLLKLKSPAYSKFVYLWLRALYANDELLQFENGTTGIKNLAFTLFSSSFKFCVAPARVLEAFDACVSPLFRREQASAAETDSLAALRDVLLPQLIAGALRVKDAERFVAGTVS